VILILCGKEEVRAGESLRNRQVAAATIPKKDRDRATIVLP